VFGRTTTPEVTVTDFATAHAAGALTVDVREPGEYAGGHVPGAINIPLSRLGTRVASLAADSKGAPVFVICASGNRSKAGAGLLLQGGLDALSVTGGTAAWSRAGTRRRAADRECRGVGTSGHRSPDAAR
jgi:rhodanese-related sulfurtransferase